MPKTKHRFIVRKIRIASGYLTRTEIVDEDYFYSTTNNVEEIMLKDIPDSYLTLAPGEQLVIHNAGVD